MKNNFCIIIFLFFLQIACEEESDTPMVTDDFSVTSVSAGSIALEAGQLVEEIPRDAVISISFSEEVEPAQLESSIVLTQASDELDYALERLSGASFEITPAKAFRSNTIYSLEIKGDLTSRNGLSFDKVTYKFKTLEVALELVKISYGSINGLGKDRVTNVPLNLALSLSFSAEVDQQGLKEAISIGKDYPLNITRGSKNSLTVTSTSELPPLNRFVLSISDNLKGVNGEGFTGYAQEFYTQLDSTYEFPEISEEALLTKVQEQTFKYFWDFAHPASGLARERNTSGDLVTIGGSGFGVMAILVGIERGFITRQQGVDRLEKIVNFLSTANRFHGVWPHWMNGNTGEVIPFSDDDNGADLVETAFMVQGLLTVRQYLNPANSQEAAIIDTITNLWEAVEWNWFVQEGEEVLTWHWSPNGGFEKNLKIRGWNEALIVYVLAASSPTHSIDAEVYHQGWARDGGIVNGQEFYNINLPLGQDRGGPLFFAHYSFLGLDPRNLSDQYANYWEQNVNHTRINRAYCVDNPLNYVGYSSACWGLTASDNAQGYSAHSPNNDLGVITPTAALSSMPYTPEQSMAALEHFYYLLGDNLWGEYGFYDAFNITKNWYADSYLAIDQGPIIIMIENYRTGLLWSHFMSAPEVRNGLEKLGFSFNY